MPPHPKPPKRIVHAFQKYPCGREVCSNTTAGKAEYARRRQAMVELQGGACAICHHPFGEGAFRATYDHAVPRGHGGGFRDDRIDFPNGDPRNAAVHEVCNGLKGSRRYHWIDGAYVPIERKA